MRHFLLLLVTLSGCTVMSDTNMLDDRTAIIGSRGGITETSGSVTKAALQEAAKQAKARGFRYFTVSSASDRSRSVVMIAPGSSSTTGTYGQGTYSATTYTGPATVTPMALPEAEIMVRFYRSGEVDPSTPGLWDAERVLTAK